MKIKAPQASNECARGALNERDVSSSTVSPPASTPSTPTGHDDDEDSSLGSQEGTTTRSRSYRKRPRAVSVTARKPRQRLARLVSQQDFSRVDETNDAVSPSCISSAGEEEEEDDDSLDSSAVGHGIQTTEEMGAKDVKKAGPTYLRCVSVLEGDKVMLPQESQDSKERVSSPVTSSIPSLPNPLHHKPLFDAHVRALRLEWELAPMRTILSKLMNNLDYNRRGIFNVPVDPIAMGLSDYELIVKHPMDLGTVKAKLHALGYANRTEVAEDIRLVFRNAIAYNPPDHFVHVNARNLLGIFEAGYLNACQKRGEEYEPGDPWEESSSAPTTLDSSVAPSATRNTTSTRPDDENRAASAQPAAAAAPPPAVTGTFVFGGDHAQSQTNPSAALTRHQPHAHPKLPVHTIGGTSGKLPPWLRPNKKAAPPHSCSACLGRQCALCKEGCITHEPTLLICNGASCGCAKIRKGAVYYVSTDGTRQYCLKCYAGLAAVLPQSGDQSDSFGSTVRYKKDLLKRKNDEEIAENWLTCTKCNQGVHQVCAMHNEYVHREQEYICPTCVVTDSSAGPIGSPSSQAGHSTTEGGCSYTFVSGSTTPVPMADVVSTDCPTGQDVLSADKLTETPVSAFIQQKVRERMVLPECPNADETVLVRIISDCEKSFDVPDIVRKHFRMPNDSTESHLDASSLPPVTVNYKSLAIALFQKIDGLDVCIFCMYVHEYDGDDDFESDLDAAEVGQGKRVYIAYLDSVEHFRPRKCRTDVYHEMLVAYLATARARGYETAHIWACPPLRGNSFVFWNHPSSQRTPTKERLITWYHGALHRAVDCGVVTDVRSLYESAFQDFMSKVREEEKDKSPEAVEFSDRPGRMVCPPLLDGDYWIEEAQRIHTASVLRYLKSKSGVKEPPSTSAEDASIGCPALQVASLLRNQVTALSSAAPFRRPVNAAALNLKDYHRIISKPMDLGTIYSRLVLGEFEDLREFVSDVELVFANATRFNPVGHAVHAMAIEVRDVFFRELNALTGSWVNPSGTEEHDYEKSNWLRFANVSMSLDTRLVGCAKPLSESIPSSLTEDDPVSSKTNEPSESKQEIPSVQAVISADETSNPILEAKAKMSTVANVATPTPAASSSSSPSQASKPTATKPAPKRRGRKPRPPPRKLDLLTDGPDAVHQCMVGDDVWLLDKRAPVPVKSATKKNGKRKKTPMDALDVPPSKRRRQSWLGEEVGMSMRRIRTSFFTCSLTPKAERSEVEHDKLDSFNEYVMPFASFCDSLMDTEVSSSRIADARHSLLEFSQYRNFEFDTLRRAKYSTSMLLYHLHHDDAPGLVPTCTSCAKTIDHVRWHEIRRRCSMRHSTRQRAEELCSECHSTRSDGDEFLPLPVSFRTSQD